MRSRNAPVTLGVPPLSVDFTLDDQQFIHRPYLAREGTAVYAGTPLPFGYGFTTVITSSLLADGQE